jgi:hypothetical protein
MKNLFLIVAFLFTTFTAFSQVGTPENGPLRASLFQTQISDPRIETSDLNIEDRFGIVINAETYHDRFTSVYDFKMPLIWKFKVKHMLKLYPFSWINYSTLTGEATPVPCAQYIFADNFVAFEANYIYFDEHIAVFKANFNIISF